MQKNTALIPIIAGYKLSDNDLAAQIKNQPHISQLRQKMEQILLLYMEQLKKQQEKKEEYVVKKAQEYMEKHCSEPVSYTHLGMYSWDYRKIPGIHKN